MKKVTLLAFTLISFFCNAQRKIDSYTMQYFNEKFDIEIGELKKEKFKIYLGLKTETPNRPGSIVLENTKIEEFKNALIQTRDKYTEWIEVAKKNEVKEMNKEMDIKFPTVDIAWLGTKWFISFGQRLKPTFIILDGNRYIVSFYNKNYSSSNKYITEGTYWVFSSVDEFNEMINKLDQEKLKKEAEGSQSNKELFK